MKNEKCKREIVQPASPRVYPILSTKANVNLTFLLISGTKDVFGGR